MLCGPWLKKFVLHCSTGLTDIPVCASSGWRSVYILLFADRASPETVILSRPSDSQFTPEEMEDLNVELERPALETIIPKDKLRSLKKDEKKRQEVINGSTVFVLFTNDCYVL